MEMSWTAQHGMGPNPNTPYNEVIVQMMCDQYLRDGTTTQRIPLTQEADTDYRFGRHESYNYYQDCQTRERNQGLKKKQTFFYFFSFLKRFLLPSSLLI